MHQARRERWQRARQELMIWRVGALPGLVIIALVVLARCMGILQPFERVALDYLLRLRPAEPTDERILVIGIDEQDIRNVGTYPIPDRDLARLLKTVQRYQPAAIGLDIFRDLPLEPGHANLVQVFKTTSNLVGAERLPPATVNPPPDLSPQQIGFVDIPSDSDSGIRRLLLYASDSKQEKFSLPLRLAEAYLLRQGLRLDQGVQDPDAMRFGSIELTPLFQPNFGGYVNADAGGYQVPFNPRSGKTPFRVVSMRDVEAGKVPESWIRDRIVLIGITAFSVKDLVNSAAVQGDIPGAIYGVKFQAHAVSQIISKVLDGRPFLLSWSDGWEYLWIVAWGVVGIGLGYFIQSPLKNLLVLGIACIVLTSICFGLMIISWWVPIVPALLVLIVNGAVLSLFYRYDQYLRARIRDRQLVIEQTFDAIHNGPLQTLARLLRDVQDQRLEQAQLHSDLNQLNQELRSVYASVRREALMQNNSFYLDSELELDLQGPTHELLYEVYNHTLTRNFPAFNTLKLRITTFEDIDNRPLTMEQKRGLCRFLEEALCNVGKHAVGMSRLDVVCKQEQDQNVIRIIDDGIGIDMQHDSIKVEPSGQLRKRGTQQAQELANQLGGEFRRFAASNSASNSSISQGTVCELTWPISKIRFWRF